MNEAPFTLDVVSCCNITILSTILIKEIFLCPKASYVRVNSLLGPTGFFPIAHTPIHTKTLRVYFLCGFPPGAPAFSHSPKTCYSQLAVYLSVNGHLSLCQS